MKMKNKVVKFEQAYWVIVENPNEGMPREMVLYETTDLDTAIQVAKNQYGPSAPQAVGIHAYVVVRDTWLSGDRTPYIDVQPD